MMVSKGFLSSILAVLLASVTVLQQSLDVHAANRRVLKGGVQTGFDVFVSLFDDRRDPVPFPGSDHFVQGQDIYVFVDDSNKDIRIVNFIIDGVEVQQDNSSPWDMQGGSKRNANPYSTSQLTIGMHVLEVLVTLRSGAVEAKSFYFGVTGQTDSPTASPTSVPTGTPTKVPATRSPTTTPTGFPTKVPTTGLPTSTPTIAPTKVPTTSSPTGTPTSSPTKVPATSSPTKSPSAPYDVSVFISRFNDRSSAEVFPGQQDILKGQGIFVFVQENPALTQVDFYIDGTLERSETIAPWDMAGSGEFLANPYDTSALSVGGHILKVDATFSSGETITVEINFDIGFDLPQFLKSQIASGNKYIVIPPGVYRVAPQNLHHVLFESVNDVTIEAYGVEMICTETTRALTIYRCSNFKVLGLTIDYDPLPYTQGVITQISADTLTHTIELFDGYPDAYQVNGAKYEIFKPDTRTLRFGSYYGITYRALDARTLEVTRASWQSYEGEQVGDIIAIGTTYAPGGGIPHGVEVYESSDVVLEDITLYTANMFAFMENRCTNTHYLRCKVDRRPLDTDIVAREDPRIRSAIADGFHSKYAPIGPKYEDCTAKYQGDDCLSINGNYDMVMNSDVSTSSSILRVLGKSGVLNVQVGDPLEIVSYTGERLPDGATVVSVSGPMSATQDEIDFLDAQWMDANIKSSMRTAFDVVIDRAVSLPMGSLIAASNRLGNYFSVTGCDFGFNRSRGIIIRASHGVVTGNKVEGSVMSAIKVEPDFWWLEGGSSNDLLIAENTLLNGGGIGIEVTASGGIGGVAPAGAHNDIVIQNNVIVNMAEEPYVVTSTDGLILSGNTFDGTPRLENCANVENFD